MGDTIDIRKTVPIVAEADVLVVGAGIAGATAAVAAAREGAATLVVDRFGCPGGNMGPGMCGGAPDLELPPVFRDGMRPFVTQIYVADEPRNSEDFLFRRIPAEQRQLVLADFRPVNTPQAELAASFDFILIQATAQG